MARKKQISCKRVLVIDCKTTESGGMAASVTQSAVMLVQQSRHNGQDGQANCLKIVLEEFTMTENERKAVKREKRRAKQNAVGQQKRSAKNGGLLHEMKRRVHLAASKEGNQMTHNYRDRAVYSCRQFDAWRKKNGWSNASVREQPLEAVIAWVKSLHQSVSPEEARDLHRKARGYKPSSIHTMVAHVCLGLGLEMTGITPTGTALEKTKSTGINPRADRARHKTENQSIVRFAEMVGGRRSAYSRLTGADFVTDRSGEYCVRFISDKGGKTQYQRIAPEDVDEVYRYFADKEADEPIFRKIDRNLDLHGIRAEHARAEYERYAKICSTLEGRSEMRKQLWDRFTDPKIGNKAWLMAASKEKAKAKEDAFRREMADGTYRLRTNNREAAILHDRPVEYDRLALLCVSVFALSHWRNEVTVKHYMI